VASQRFLKCEIERRRQLKSHLSGLPSRDLLLGEAQLTGVCELKKEESAMVDIDAVVEGAEFRRVDHFGREHPLRPCILGVYVAEEFGDA